MKFTTIASLAIVALAVMFVADANAAGVDVLVVVDESGSMSTEHAWISTMISSLDAELGLIGIAGNYGLVGYGGASSHLLGHKHLVGGSDFGTSAQFGTATGGLVLTGGTEDGWQAIDWALDNYAFTPGNALNVILITDEDRDNANGNALTYAGVLAKLTANGALLNAVVNSRFDIDAGVNNGLGSNEDTPGGIGYVADGFGGFTTGTVMFSSGVGTTKANYMELAWDTGGAAWNLNKLRDGGLTAASFTEAFVDIKVEEIQNQVPEPGTLILLGGGLGLMGLVSIRRRRNRKAA